MSRRSYAFLAVLIAMTIFFIVAGPAQAGVVYVGPADLIDGIDDGLYLGSATFAEDRLVVEVNGQVVRNRWNGMLPGGSGTLWNYTFLYDWTTGAITMTQSHGVTRFDGEPPVHIWSVR
jgi:hypothetical protein